MLAIKKESCYSKLAAYEQKILSAAYRLNQYILNSNTSLSQLYKDDFLDYCDNGACEDAVEMLISSLDGNPGISGCDLIEIFH